MWLKLELIGLGGALVYFGYVVIKGGVRKEKKKKKTEEQPFIVRPKPFRDI